MRILLTGSKGQLGVEIQRSLGSLASITPTDIEELDICDPQAVATAVRDIGPHFIINTAAYTAVDKAEQDPKAAHAVNADAPRILAEAATKVGAGVIHYSTDYVFDGTKAAPYVESDARNPLGVYGESKAAGERAVMESGAPHLVLRTSWIYGTHGKNFLLTILRLACEKEELSIVDDQIGAPTWSRALAEGTRDILMRVKSPEGLSKTSGLYHMTAGGRTSWCGFTRAIIEEYRANGHDRPWMQQAIAGRKMKIKEVRGIATSEYPLPARRPQWSVLSNDRLRLTFGVELADWRDQLRQVMQSDD